MHACLLIDQLAHLRMRRRSLFEQLVLFDCVDCDFLFSAAVLADAPLLDVPKPFRPVAIGLRTQGFEDD